jgi:regulator of sigma E protease
MNLSWQHLLAFLVAICLLVAVHEFGHYWVARRLGFKVLKFSIGFGRPLFKWVAGADQTEYVLAAIPLGGYVKLLDEREGEVDPAQLHRAFTRRPVWQRILVLLAGPAFNFAFAILLLAGLFWFSGITEVRAVVGDVQVNTPAARAGLRSGDVIQSVAGQTVAGQRDVMMDLLAGLTDAGGVSLTVADGQGTTRQLLLAVESSDLRRQLTEPDRMLATLGFTFWQPPIPAVLGLVEPKGPAALAGLLSGDTILAVNDSVIGDFRDLRQHIELLGGQEIVLRYRRQGTEASARVQVASDEVNGRRIGRIHVGPAAGGAYPESMLQRISLGPLSALVRGTTEAWDMTVLQARLFWRMLRGDVSLKNLSGPLTIAEYAGDSAKAGMPAFLSFLVMISLSLGFLNLLPIPMLDGGQVVYQLAEGIRGRPLPERIQALGQQLGIVLLVLLMGVAWFNDYVRHFG